jgi:hypothetical protein
VCSPPLRPQSPPQRRLLSVGLRHAHIQSRRPRLVRPAPPQGRHLLPGTTSRRPRRPRADPRVLGRLDRADVSRRTSDPDNNEATTPPSAVFGERRPSSVRYRTDRRHTMRPAVGSSRLRWQLPRSGPEGRCVEATSPMVASTRRHSWRGATRRPLTEPRGAPITGRPVGPLWDETSIG